MTQYIQACVKRDFMDLDKLVVEDPDETCDRGPYPGETSGRRPA